MEIIKTSKSRGRRKPNPRGAEQAHAKPASNEVALEAAVAQLAARRSHNPKVVSSILTCRSYWCGAREAPVHTSHMLQLSSRCSVVYPCYPLQALPMWDLCFFFAHAITAGDSFDAGCASTCPASSTMRVRCAPGQRTCLAVRVLRRIAHHSNMAADVARSAVVLA